MSQQAPIKINEQNLGLDTSIKNIHQRLLDKNGKSNIKRVGLNSFAFYNLYHKLVTISWGAFFFIVFAYLGIVNILFALCYHYILPLEVTSVQALNYHPVVKSFFLSCQTFASFGFPTQGLFSNLIATFQAMVGVLTFSIITGLLYGRFSKPSAKMFFSENILVSPFKNIKILSFRLANAKIGQLIEADAQLIISIVQKVNNESQRKFHNVKLINNQMTFFTGSWTISHIIDKDSPIYNLDSDDFKEKNIEFILMIKATDDTYGQTVHSRISYTWNEVIWDAVFKPIVEVNGEGNTLINIKNVGQYEFLKS